MLRRAALALLEVCTIRHLKNAKTVSLGNIQKLGKKRLARLVLLLMATCRQLPARHLASIVELAKRHQILATLVRIV